MPVQEISALKSMFPIGVQNGTTATAIHHLIDTLEFRTSQAVLTKTSDYPASVNDNRSAIIFNSATPVTLTLPNDLPAGWECIVIQIGAGQVTIASVGGSIRSPNNHTKLLGQWARVDLKVFENVGTAPQVSMMGSTAA